MILAYVAESAVPGGERRPWYRDISRERAVR